MMTTTIKPTTQFTESMYSDLHKDVYGHRPRNLRPLNKLELALACADLMKIRQAEIDEQTKIEAERVAKIRARNAERKQLAGSWFSRLLEEAK